MYNKESIFGDGTCSSICGASWVFCPKGHWDHWLLRPQAVPFRSCQRSLWWCYPCVPLGSLRTRKGPRGVRVSHILSRSPLNSVSPQSLYDSLLSWQTFNSTSDFISFTSSLYLCCWLCIGKKERNKKPNLELWFSFKFMISFFFQQQIKHLSCIHIHLCYLTS